MARGACLDPETFRLRRSGEAILNGDDANAVEEGLRIKEAAADGEVVAVSLGPVSALGAIESALAMGADRGLLVSDDRASGSDLLATSYVLARALEEVRPDAILFGQGSSDGEGSVLWAAVADRLGLPFISQATEAVFEGDMVTARRQTRFGYERIGARLPAVIAVADAINEPRFPSLQGIIGARGKARDVVTLADLEVEPEMAGEAGSRTEVLAIQPPPARREPRTIEDDGSAAERILEVLVERQLI